jgi:RND family efflux transporter MFP subunit
MHERLASSLRKSAALVALLAHALVLPGCESRQRPRPEDRPATPAGSASSRLVELALASDMPIERRLQIAGTLEPDERVIVSAKVTGRLASLAVDIASRVEPGQVIAEIEPRDYQLEVEQARASLAQARAELGLEADETTAELDVDNTAIVREARATRDEAATNLARARSLAKEGLATGSALDAAEASAVRAETSLQAAREQVRIRKASVHQRAAGLRAAQQKLADAELRAPIHGIVQARLTSVGSYLAAGAPVVEIVRIDPLRLRIAVPERDAPSVHEGQPVSVQLEGDQRTYGGKVTRLSPALDTGSRTLLVEADIANPGNLRPGNFVRAEIAIGARPALTIPKRAVVVFAGLTKVVLVERGEAVERTVVLGDSAGDRVEVLSGLKAGEAVVVAPGSLQQGQRVRVKDAR